MVTQLRGQRIAPRVVAVAELLGVGVLSLLLAQAEFLVDQADHPVAMLAQVGITLEVIGDGRAFAPLISTPQVDLDQGRQH